MENKTMYLDWKKPNGQWRYKSSINPEKVLVKRKRRIKSWWPLTWEYF